MRVAVLQPSYLSWSGYYGMIASVQRFVFLDDVQLERDTRTPWQYKNRIKGPNGEIPLTIPRIHNGLEKIKDVRINYATDWPRKHLLSIEQAYAYSSYTGVCLDLLAPWLNARIPLLAHLTTGIIEQVCCHLGLQTEFLRASDLGVTGSRVEHLEGILRAAGATQYLANPGSKGYLEPCLPLKGIETRWFNFKHPVYPQRGEFMSHLSIVDLLCNTGPTAMDYIKEGCQDVWR